MRRNELTATRRLLAAWRQLQAQSNHLAMESDDAETLAGIADVRDYIVGQIEALERRLIAPNRAGKVTPSGEPFAIPSPSPQDAARTLGKPA